MARLHALFVHRFSLSLPGSLFLSLSLFLPVSPPLTRRFLRRTCLALPFPRHDDVVSFLFPPLRFLYHPCVFSSLPTRRVVYRVSPSLSVYSRSLILSLNVCPQFEKTPRRSLVSLKLLFVADFTRWSFDASRSDYARLFPLAFSLTRSLVSSQSRLTRAVVQLV